jgi:hypothetical protein
MRRVHETIVAVGKQQVLYISVCVRACVCVCVRVCVGGGVGMECTGAGVCLRACSLTNPALNAPPYCNLRLLWLHHIFPLYLINGTIFGKRLLNIKCVFSFSLLHSFETFLILRRIQRDTVINVKTSSRTTRNSSQILMKLECSRQIIEKTSHIKFNQNPFSGSRTVPCGRTAGREKWRS